MKWRQLLAAICGPEALIGTRVNRLRLLGVDCKRLNTDTIERAV